MAQGKMIRKEPDSPPVPSTPGIGVSGIVMCPLFKGVCMKHGCEFWVELHYGDQYVGRCSLAWNTILMTELRQSVDKLTAVMAAAK